MVFLEFWRDLQVFQFLADKIQYTAFCYFMQDKHFKPIVIENKQSQSGFNDYEKLSSSKISKGSSTSKNKLFIRKPTSKRNGLNSPNFIKKQSAQINAHNNKLMFNEEYKKNLNECKSDQNIRDLKFYMKYSINAKKKSQSREHNDNIYSSRQIKQAYFGETIHHHTQATQSCKIETGSSDNSQKELFFVDKPKMNENLIINANHKKTRTQYFRQEDHKSSTSRSNKQKQIDFLKARLQFNPEAYTSFLEDNIKRLQTANHALNKKSKWMQEQIQMHLQKQYIMDAEKNGLNIQIKNLKEEIRKLKQQKLCLKRENEDLMKKTKNTNKGSNSSFSSIQNTQQIKSYRIFRKLQIISLPHIQIQKAQDPSINKNKQYFEELQNSHREFRQQSNKKIAELEKNIFWKDLQIQAFQKEKDRYQDSLKIKENELHINKTTIDVLKQNLVDFQMKNSQNQTKIESLIQKIFQAETENKLLSEELSVLKSMKVSSQQTFFGQMKKFKESCSEKDILNQNPLRFMSKNSQNLQDQNVALKQYIGRILEQYKYLKIQNRMLQKLKQELVICQKQKKQLKQERDMFKKKVMQNLKAKNRRMMLDSSQASSDSIFQLSSQIHPNQHFQ